MLGKSHAFVSRLLTSLLIKSFKNTIRVPYELDPDQDQHCVGHDLGPNCLQLLPLARKELRWTYTNEIGTIFSRAGLYTEVVDTYIIKKKTNLIWVTVSH